MNAKLITRNLRHQTAWRDFETCRGDRVMRFVLVRSDAAQGVLLIKDRALRTAYRVFDLRD